MNVSDAGRACSLILEAIDAHMHGAHQRSSNVVVGLTLDGGIGDQLSSFLGTLTLAVGTQRRLEILPDGNGTTSYIDAGFRLAFDAKYSGRQSWIHEARQASPSLEANATQSLKRLPHLRASHWGLTLATDEAALAARLLVPSPSGIYPPMHPKVFQQPHEFVVGGNFGAVVFRSFFERTLRQRGVKYRDDAVGCVLRRLLQPSPAVNELIAQLRPPQMRRDPLSLGEVSTASMPASAAPLLIGVHIRARAHLINRAARSESARYELRSPPAVRDSGFGDGPFAADLVFKGCGTHAPAASEAISEPQPQIANFSEYWLAALAATRRWSGREADARGRLPTARWLIVSDTAALKAEAHKAWPHLVAISSVEPAPPHVRVCDHASAATATVATAAAAARRAKVLHTIAELYLLSEADVLVLGRSRFPMAALLLSRTCRASLHLFLDRRCRRARRPRPLIMNSTAERPFAPSTLEQSEPPAFDASALSRGTSSRKALRCFGTGAEYSARTLQGVDGRLQHDGMLSYF